MSTNEMTTDEWHEHMARKAAALAAERMVDRLIFLASNAIVAATWYALLSLGIIQ